MRKVWCNCEASDTIYPSVSIQNIKSQIVSHERRGDVCEGTTCDFLHVLMYEMPLKSLNTMID